MKFSKKIFLRILSLVIIGLVVAFISNIMLDWVHSGFDSEYVNELFDTRTRLYVIGSMILFIVYLWLVSLLGSKYLASMTLLLISFGIGITSSLKMEYRGEPLYPMELQMFTDIPYIMEMVEWREMVAYILLIVLFICFIIFTYLKIVRKQEQVFPTKISYTLRTVGIVLTSILLFYIYQFNEVDNRIRAQMDNVAEWVTYDQPRNYAQNGFLAGFIYNFEASPMDPLDDYSEQKIEELLDKYQEVAEEINSERDHYDSDTNVIYIMNETFSDPLRLDGFEASNDPIPFYRELTNESRSGNSLTQGVGGGTANSEFEALTTMSLEAFAPNITSPYVQLTETMRYTPNIVSTMNNMGYHTTAIHSHHPRLYKRVDVYNMLGFDNFIYDSLMRSTHRINDDHPYISDDAAYKEILEVLKETNDPSFIHLVTMQNHMPHNSKYDNPDFETVGSNRPDSANAYLQDLFYSDEALEELIIELETLEEDSVVVFWGDHLPSVGRVYGEGSEVMELNDNGRTFFETPLFVYSTVENIDQELGTRSPMFFINHVLDMLDLKVTPYQALLLELEERLPAFRDGLYILDDQEHVEKKEDLDEETRELLQDYYLLQYDITTGRRYAERLGFFDQ